MSRQPSRQPFRTCHCTHKLRIERGTPLFPVNLMTVTPRSITLRLVRDRADRLFVARSLGASQNFWTIRSRWPWAVLFEGRESTVEYPVTLKPSPALCCPCEKRVSKIDVTAAVPEFGPSQGRQRYLVTGFAYAVALGPLCCRSFLPTRTKGRQHPRHDSPLDAVTAETTQPLES
jgi:hypothetical protein